MGQEEAKKSAGLDKATTLPSAIDRLVDRAQQEMNKKISIDCYLLLLLCPPGGGSRVFNRRPIVQPTHDETIPSIPPLATLLSILYLSPICPAMLHAVLLSSSVENNPGRASGAEEE